MVKLIIILIMLFLSKQVETNKERQKLIDEKKIIKNLR